MKELPLPDGAKEPQAQEMARIWVTPKDLLVTLNVGCYAGKDGPGETTAWGDILADTIKHLARAISSRLDESPTKVQREILARCTEALLHYEKEFSGQLK